MFLQIVPPPIPPPPPPGLPIDQWTFYAFFLAIIYAVFILVKKNIQIQNNTK